MFTRPLLLSLVIGLAACSDEHSSVLVPEARDPAVVAAINDPIMVDPDLTGQNRPTAALVGGEPATAAIPTIKRSSEAIAAAKADAEKLAGAPLQMVPSPSSENDDSVSPESVGQAAAALPGRAKKCLATVSYSAIWAARMPAALPIYPRGSVQEAAGNDANGCKLRVVNFQTPVSVEDVLAFYYTRLNASGAVPAHRLEGPDHVLSSSKAGTNFVVFVRKLDNGLTEVDLVSG